MHCMMKQDINESWSMPFDESEILDDAFYIWAPFVVQHRVEYDYLFAAILLRGKDTSQVLLDGVHENKTEYPPSFVTIPELIA